MRAARWAAAAAMVVALALGGASSWAQGVPRARLVRVSGGVGVQRGGSGVWHPITTPPDHLLYPGDHLQTYQRASASISIDGALETLGPRTEVVIPPRPGGRPPRAPSRLRVIVGKILSWLMGTRDLEIGAAGAVAAARGTKFVTEVAEDGRTTLTVIEGQVSFFNDLGSVVVSQGEQSTATPDSPPTRSRIVDLSGYLEWDASLENIWLGFETRYHPSETRARLEEMLEPARRQVEATPGDPKAQEGLGDLLADLGDGSGAEAAYRKAIELTPNSADLHLSLGYALLMDGRRPEALAEFEAAARLAPTDAAPLVGQAAAEVAAVQEDHLARAADLLQSALKLQPEYAPAHLVAGLLAMRRGDAQVAEQSLRRAIELDASSFQAHSYLSVVQLATGDSTAALDSARKAVGMAPASALAHQSLATAYAFTGDLRQAGKEADLALQANAESPAAHLVRAQVRLAAGDLAGARDEAQLAVTLDPLLAPAYSAVGMIALAQNDLRAAQQAFDRAVAISPKLAAAQTGLGVVYARQGKLAAAMKAQKAAIALDDRLAATHNNLGAVCLARGLLADAVAEFAEAIHLQPTWSMPHANLAMAYLDLNRFADAVREGELAVRLGEDSARTHTTLARVYLEQNRLNKAWASLRRAIELDGTYALAHLEMGEVYLQQGRARDAQREQLEAITLEPASMLETRQYARTEARVEAGSSFRGRAKTDGRGDDGQNSFYTSFEYERNSNGRPHSTWDRHTEVAALGRQPAADQTCALYLSAQDEDRDKPGRALPGDVPEDPNYRSSFNGREAQALARLPLGSDGRVTLRLGYRQTTQVDHNPDALLPDPKPFPRLEIQYRGPMGEARLDQRVSSRNRLVAGAAASGETREVSGVMATLNPPGSPDPVTYTPFDNQAGHNAATLYLEDEQRFGPDTRVMLGGRLATAQHATPVWRPKAYVVQDLGRGSTVILLTRPVLRDDVSELSPVDHWALPDGLSPLDLGGGGFSQSYELQYQLMPRNGSLFRVAGFYRTLRNFIVDLQDPQWAPGQAGAVVAAGSLQGAQVECEHWLTREISARAWLRFTDSKNGAGPGLDIPLQPRLTSQVAADFLSHSGLRGELSWVHVGSRYADLPNATRLGSYDVLNLRAAHQFNLHLDVFVVIDNVLGNRYEFWPDYPARGRTIQAGAEYRF